MNSENRDLVVKFRVTKQEKERLVGLAEHLMMDMSQYLRRRALSNADTLMVTGRDFRVATDAIGAELGKIGSNINQFARYANSLYNSNQIDPEILRQFRDALLEYRVENEKLISIYTALLKTKKL
jgi:hypothetical protein